MTTLKRNAILGLILFALCVHGRADMSISTLERLVAQWIELRSAVAAEQRDWQEQKQHLEREIVLLQRERDVLSGHLKESEAELAPLREDQVDLEARHAKLRTAVAALEPAIARAEEDLRQWRAIIPEGIAGPLLDAFGRIPASSEETKGHSITRRLQLVIALYTEIESLQHGYHASKEILATSDNRGTEVDVLYVGLSRAYAVSPAGDWAATGSPGADGWTWTPAPEIAPSVSKALRILRQEEVADLVTLPVGLSPRTGREQEQ